MEKVILPERFTSPRAVPRSPARVLRNVGGFERGARVGVGLASVLAAQGAAPGLTQVALSLLGAAGLLTGFAGYCPVNKTLGRDTTRVQGGRTI